MFCGFSKFYLNPNKLISGLIKKMAIKTSLLVAFTLVFCAFVKAQPTSRIVGGKDADIGQFPYQIVLYKDGSFTCGGSIISSRYVLTAAHCVVIGDGIETLPGEYFTVRMGSIQRMAGGKIMQVKKVTVRKTYGNFLDDVALLELEDEIKFTKNIQKIDLFDGVVPNNASVTISGWGRLTTGGKTPQRLQYNTLTKLDPSKCEETIGYGTDQILCLAHSKNNGACNGDSGGPATYDGKLVGVAGFVVDGCGSNYPDGYANVSYHRKWILENMK
ncbi:serine protease SP24D-like [Episyrphus balteatus]|uniref:serine protease SP24D-like n=1 Tax=Episyrphus balteatus TaxID=286459 RepID=UPI002486314F|nr:serine protease SP24D-like [Episyrphus balteatus]